MRKWWVVRHVCSEVWEPCKAITVFGIPLVTFFYVAEGPYHDLQEASLRAYFLNRNIQP